jgi:hypothetical protein
VVTYAASESAGAAPRCADNMKAAYVLISDIGATAAGRNELSTGMGLCTPLKSKVDVNSLLTYLQSPLFNLAEGSYPFPSNYITFALTGSDAPLPAWAMQSLCSHIANDFGATITGDTEQVVFEVTIGDVKVSVNWDTTSNNKYTMESVKASGLLNLLQAVAQSTQVWYNVTGELPSCINWDGSVAPNDRNSAADKLKSFSHEQAAKRTLSRSGSHHVAETKTAVRSNDGICTASDDSIDAGTAWNVLTCNEGINLVNWEVQGVGNDLYWPPNRARNYTLESVITGSLGYCAYYSTYLGLFGIPKQPDEWSIWLENSYGGSRALRSISNIVYTNGNLDPWQPAGVAITEDVPSDSKVKVTEVDGIVSVVIDMGGHHLDLFWDDANDPDSVK